MKQSLKHILTMLSIWAAILLLEGLFVYILTLSSQRFTFEFRDILNIWGQTLPFAILYIVHDLTVAPLLTEKKKLWPYLLGAATVLALFSIYVFNLDKTRTFPPHEQFRDFQPREQFQAPPHFPAEGYAEFHERPQRKGEMPPERPLKPEYQKLIVALLLIGVDLGSRYYIRYRAEVVNHEKLEKENLKYRLEYLRYQINPHFFMNTLNNIHALVDIDSEKAKDSIVELSKMMRHILYESSGPTIPLSKEIEFLMHYIALMRLRFTNRVKIDCKFTDDCKGYEVPPLLMATVIENAFKHGVSYTNDSHIGIDISTGDGVIIFRCENSLKNATDADSCGIGLNNIRNRLALLYGEDYTMHIDSGNGRYTVVLVLPSRSKI